MERTTDHGPVPTIRSEEILDLGDYERARAEVRRRAIEARAVRRVEVGPSATLAFENHETVRYQIQEMLRAERIVSREGIAHEIETYSELLPTSEELSATLMLEYPNVEERAARLAQLRGIEGHVHLTIDVLPPIRARFDARQIDADGKVSAVQFVRFALGPEHLAALRPGAGVRLIIDHPRYAHAASLPPATVAALAADLKDARRSS